MKNYLLSITLLLVGGVLFSSCKQTPDKLILNTKGLTEKKEKVIKFYSYSTKELGTLKITHNGKTEFVPQWEEPQVVTIYEKENSRSRSISFMSEKGNVILNLMLNGTTIDFENTTIDYVKNTKNVKLFQKFQKKQREFQTKDEELAKKWNALVAKYKTKEELAKVRKPLDDAYNTFLKEKSKYYKDYAKTHNNLITQLLYLTKLRFSINVKSLGDILKATPKENKQTPYYKELEEKHRILKNLVIGKVAPEIVLPDTLGNNLALSSLRGQYVLLDFWASWCGPCRKENPWVRKAYKRFHEKGFDVYAVSLDYPEQKDRWLTAIRKDKLPWHHVSALKGWRDSHVKTYNLSGIPSPFLLDPEGRIIAKGNDLREEKLIETLEKYLK